MNPSLSPSPRRHFRTGSAPQFFWFALAVGFYVVGVLLFTEHKLAAVGQPDVGWTMDWHQVSPSRLDSAEAGLRGGGRAIEINGKALEERSLRADVRATYRLGIGDSNTLTMLRPSGRIETFRLRVRALSWGDVFYAEGATLLLGVLFFGVGLLTFLLRPFEPTSWALLALGAVAGAFLTALKLEANAPTLAHALYYRTAVGFLASVPLHAMLAYPVVHPWLRRDRSPLVWIYALGVGHTAIQIAAWQLDWTGPFRYVGIFDTTLMLIALGLFVSRCAYFSMRSADPLTAQRARILLGGAVFGAGVPALTRFMQTSFGLLIFDNRFAYWALAVLLVALARTALRQELMNSRVAVRRALIYGVSVIALTLVAIAMVSITPYLVALLLLPLLYIWPTFVESLDMRLYPKRRRFAEIVRGLNEELGGTDDIAIVLEKLAEAPGRISDASLGAAVLFASEAGRDEIVRMTHGEYDGPTLRDEPLVQMITTTRKAVTRHQIDVEPLYENIQVECYQCFNRLGAEIILPIYRDANVVGLVGIGARTTGDPYEALDLEVLETVAQQAMQSIARIEANEKLRAREREFSDLGRFFSPQIIDQVMDQGGTAELRSTRKPVTVLFADLRGFTSFAERVEPEEVMRTLAEYHEPMGARISEFDGTLERFVGDGFMVFFNDPVEQPDHVERCVRMALAMLGDVQELRETWVQRGHDIAVGMGIHTGFATCGFIGYEGRRDYGVIGTVTNLAARLSDAAGGGEVLVSAPVRAELSSQHLLESAGQLTLSGFQQPQAAFRLLPPATPTPQ